MMCSQCGERPRYARMNICTVCRGERRRADPKEKQRNREYKRKRYADPEGRQVIKSQYTKWRYGVTMEEIDAMVAAQGGCAICGTPKPPRTRGWHVDHDHACCKDYPTCGKCNRGILCHDCNLGLGNFKDNPFRLLAAIEYLRKTA